MTHGAQPSNSGPDKTRVEPCYSCGKPVELPPWRGETYVVICDDCAKKAEEQRGR